MGRKSLDKLRIGKFGIIDYFSFVEFVILY